MYVCFSLKTFLLLLFLYRKKSLQGLETQKRKISDQNRPENLQITQQSRCEAQEVLLQVILTGRVQRSRRCNHQYRYTTRAFQNKCLPFQNKSQSLRDQETEPDTGQAGPNDRVQQKTREVQRRSRNTRTELWTGCFVLQNSSSPDQDPWTGCFVLQDSRSPDQDKKTVPGRQEEQSFV